MVSDLENTVTRLWLYEVGVLQKDRNIQNIIWKDKDIYLQNW